MDLMRVIQDTQQKPRQVRQKILFISVTISMVVVVASWLIITRRNMEQDIFSAPAKPAQTETAQSPFGILKELVEETVNTIRTQLQNSFGSKP